MQAHDWQAADWRVASADPKGLAEARTQAANAVHWLARLAHSYLPPAARHRHTWLDVDAARRAFRTKPFADGVSVEVRLPALEMQFREGDRPVPHILAVEGHSPAKVEAWVLVELLHRGIDRDRFSKALPYEPDNLMSGDNVEYSPEMLAAEFGVLADWLGNADRALSALAAREGVEARLVCWPEQFHIGLGLPVTADGDANGRTLRVALSLGDERHAEPYFFVAAENGEGIETPHPGTVLTSSRIAAEGMSPEAVAAALSNSIATTRRRLAH